MKMRTLNEAAEILGVSRSKLRNGILAGKYPAIRWGNRYLVDVDALRSLLEAEDAIRDTVGLRACAEALGLKEGTLRRMTLAGAIPYRKSGNRYRYNLADVEAALERMMEQDGERD